MIKVIPITEKKILLQIDNSRKPAYKGYGVESCTFKPSINKKSLKIAKVKKKEKEKFENFVITERDDENKGDETLRVKKVNLFLYRKG